MSLTRQQIYHNKCLDMEIARCERLEAEELRVAKEMFAELLRQRPDYPYKSNPFIPMTHRSIIGIRYVE